MLHYIESPQLLFHELQSLVETSWSVHAFKSPVQEFLFLLQFVMGDGLKDQELSSKRTVYQNVGSNARLTIVALVIGSQQ